ncbi:MAG TPA: thiamine pyrophosphate-requiring protein [Stellaceae bacterium]|nr:thiamine pyrophosphate-requiring protein [Stellaceae bacterium]
MDRDPTPDRPNAPSAADALLQGLKAHGVEYFFANPGTDFPSIIEGFARAGESGAAVPRPLLVPHETAAVAMAHGVYMVSGRPQAVMVHTNVGTGNTINTLINAARDNVPMVLMAGRSPLSEKGHRGARTRYIQWAQEMFDQAGMVREIVKWDYELRLPDQVEEVLARAFELAMSSPRGPVYLTLPREILASAASATGKAPPRRQPPEPPYADPQAIDTLAEWLAAAKKPLIITAGIGRTPGGVAALAQLVERFALPVVAFNPRFLALPSTHPMHQGFQPRPLIEEADVVLVVECDVPWIPSIEGPPESARIAHLGEDPAFARYPLRGFPADLSITAAAPAALAALERALATRLSQDAPAIVMRRHALAERAAELAQRRRAETDRDGQADYITPAFLSRAIGEAVGTEAIIVNEYPLRLEHCPRSLPGSYFGLSPAGGLGWGFGAALGAKLAAPDKLVVATLGDGAYVFANPTACHWVAAADELPILVVVFNNGLYGAVRNATLDLYKSGAAARDGARLLADLGPSPAYEKLVEASGGYGIRVEKPQELLPALERAVAVVTREKRQALVNVICRY